MPILPAAQHQEIGFELWKARKQAVATVFPYLLATIKPPQLKKIRKNHTELIEVLDTFRDFFEGIAHQDLTAEQAHAFFRPDSQGEKIPEQIAGLSCFKSERFLKRIEAMKNKTKSGSGGQINREDLEDIRQFYEYGIFKVISHAWNELYIDSLTADQKQKEEVKRLTGKFAYILWELTQSIETLEKEVARDEQ